MRVGGGSRRLGVVARVFASGFVMGVCVAGSAAAQAANSATSQATSLSRALDLESAGKCREAIPVYREAMARDDPTPSVLGLERCYSQVGRSDSLLPLLDSLLVRRPKDPTLRTVHLRTLVGLRRASDAEAAFMQWTALAVRDPSPYREYARLLLEEGRPAAADTVLRSAVRVLGASRDLAAEFAQMQSALGLWVASAKSWREASEAMPYLEQAAVFSLYQAPAAVRDSVRQVFLAPPVALGARRMLAGLETKWKSAREGWSVLADVPPSDSVVQAWIDFGQDAEQNEAWLTARDAYAAAFARRPADRALALRAATAAMTGGEPQSALELLRSFAGSSDASVAATATLLQARALSALGRGKEVEALLAERGASLDAGAKRQVQRALAWGWIRSGDLPKAKAALAAAGGGTEEDERAAGWLALYDGDLKTARTGLRRTDETSRDVVTAMALLSRTRIDYSPPVGQAFLALARGDTADASKRFERTAAEVADAAPLLLLLAARLSVAARDTARATVLWQKVIDGYADAPEAAEAELDWSRVLRRRGETASAVAHLEHLILTYPQSALVPQARRELELARGGVPPGKV